MEPLHWAAILIFAGFLIVFLELFIPSAGILGIAAAVCMISGVVVAFFHSAQAGLISLLSVLTLLPVLVGLMVKVWPYTPIGRRILIGPVAREDVALTGNFYDELQSLPGRLGVVRTPMLPSGIVVIDGKKYDATSDGLPLDPGQTIQVTSVQGNRIFVSKYEGETGSADASATAEPDVLAQPLEELGLDDLDEPLS